MMSFAICFANLLMIRHLINEVAKEIVNDVIQNASDESQEELDIEESAIKRLHRKLIK